MSSNENWNAKRYRSKGHSLEFAFVGSDVATVRFGGIVQFQLNDDFQIRIELWMPFSVAEYGQAATYNPQKPTTLALLLAAIGTRLVQASTNHAGFLTLVFDNNMTIIAPADETGFQYEAWQIEDKHGFQVVCAIGGRAAIFQPNAQIAKKENNT